MDADATSLALALEALQRSEQRYRSLVDATASFVWVARPDGALQSDMPRWREITGQELHELLGSGWLDAIHPDDAPGVAEAWNQAVETAGTYAVEYRIRDKAGGWRHLFVRGTPVFDSDSSVREFVGLCIDVTDRAELASALDQERSVLQAVVDQMPVAVALVWGPDRVFRLVNERYYDLVPTRRLIGLPIAEALPEAAERAEAVLGPAYEGETVRLEDVHVAWETGDRWYAATASPVRESDGSVGGVLVVAVDRTAEVRRRAGLERALEQERVVADTLQRALLPELLPQPPGIECAARYSPGADDVLVGGDFYEVLELDDGRLGLVVGDVAGRGVRAAAVMGQLRAAVRAYAAEAPNDPAGVVERTAEFFYRYEPAEMATLVYAVVDPRTRTVELASAGHLPALVVEPGARARLGLDAQVAPLGAPATRPRCERVGPLEAGSTVVLYTDGLVERRDEGIDEGLERLRAAAAAADGLDVQAFADELVRATAPGGDRDDDLALLAVRFV